MCLFRFSDLFWQQLQFWQSIWFIPSQHVLTTSALFNNWIYLPPGPDRAHRHKQNCIYPQLFGFKPVLRTYALHTTSSIIEYIPPPLGLTGPTDRKTKLHISTIVWLQISFLLIYFAHNILYNWIYPTSGPDRAHRHKLNVHIHHVWLPSQFQANTLDTNCPQQLNISHPQARQGPQT